MIFLLFALSGLVTGLLAGLLGIGGGVITVPALYYIFYYFGYPEEESMRVCIATALAATFLTSLGSTWAHHRKLAILPSVLKLIVPGLVIGCIAGAILAHFLPGGDLRIFFSSMAILFALYFFFPKLPPINIAPHPNRSLTLIGFFIGTLSTLLGVGGGIFMVPALLGYHVPLKNVIATSSAGTLVTAFIGSISFLIIAWDHPPIPMTLGYIQIPAFLIIGLCSFLTTSLGVKLAQILPSNWIKRIFAMALAVTGVAMLLRH